ncbi:uncharacterized protein NPIL_312341 [Nephila pilipes]|uniref:Sushi domain-containing protein n=1 Tax=Nephila pilipes TaxID=299642 RepID=A0A8X6NPP0_NEPPI|nr:uncharacterized protein NPIL_312341 [Nephila pilipes]
MPRRVKRELCAYPRNLRTADVVCKTTVNAVNCTQVCIFGHTFKEGVTRTMTCSKKENVWHPFGFEECDPFVDCSVSLISPGSVDCYTGTTRSSPMCYVSCQSYEDQKAIPRRTYECQLNGIWNRPLPFCVTSGSGNTIVSQSQ